MSADEMALFAVVSALALASPAVAALQIDFDMDGTGIVRDPS